MTRLLHHEHEKRSREPDMSSVWPLEITVGELKASENMCLFRISGSPEWLVGLRCVSGSMCERGARKQERDGGVGRGGYHCGCLDSLSCGLCRHGKPSVTKASITSNPRDVYDQRDVYNPLDVYNPRGD